MIRLLTALAAIAMAVALFAPRPAEAGVRIGFGMPLGHFTATPSYGGRSYYRGHRRSRAASQSYSRKKARVAAKSSRRSQNAKVARMREIQEARRRRAIARAEAARENVAKARVRDAGSEKTEAKAVKTKPANDDPKESTVAEPTPLAPAPATPPSGPVATKVEPALVPAAAKVASDEPATPPAKPVVKAKDEPKADCKKFLPAVGLTVSVPCT